MRRSSFCNIFLSRPAANASEDFLSQRDDDARRAAHVAEPVFVLVLDHLANEFGAGEKKTPHPKRQRAGALQNANALALRKEPREAFWSAVVLHRFWWNGTRALWHSRSPSETSHQHLWIRIGVERLESLTKSTPHPKRQRTGALQNANALALRNDPREAFWSAVVLHRFW